MLERIQYPPSAHHQISPPRDQHLGANHWNVSLIPVPPHNGSTVNSAQATIQTEFTDMWLTWQDYPLVGQPSYIDKDLTLFTYHSIYFPRATTIQERSP